MISHPKKIDKYHQAHGHTRVDEYDWMRAENWQEVMENPDSLAPEIRAHLDGENAHFQAYWAGHKDLKQQLFDELKGRIQEQDDTLPVKNTTHAYWSRYQQGQQYAILMRAPADDFDAAEATTPGTAHPGTAHPDTAHVVWDENKAAQDHPYYRLGVAGPDPKDQFMILGEDTRGSEQYDLRVLDMRSGDFLPDLLPKTGGGGIWDGDGQSFFYLKLDENHRPYRVMRHVLGQHPDEDTLVFEETDPGFFVGVSKTESGAFILIETGDHITSEVHILPAHEPDQAPTCVAQRQTGHEYSLTHVGDDFYILTNRGGDAVDFEVCRAPIKTPTQDQWQSHIPHQAGRLILSIFSVQGYVMRVEREAALPRLCIEDIQGGRSTEVAFDEAAYALGAGPASGDFRDQVIRFTYSSPTTPASTYDLDLRTGARTLRKVQQIPSGHDASAYVVERHQVTARDGAEIPLTLLRRKGVEGPCPAYVYGYGSYGMATPAGFSTHALSLVDRGMIYAIAHIRGGMEQGYGWYLDGKLHNKQNTFNDFEDCVRYLIETGHTAAGQVAMEGGSAGGLLMGAVMNQAPELFGAVVAHVPFVDVLNTISDATLPLTPIEWNEWGNPIDDPAAYATIAAYSPYDQVREQPYPALMVTAGISDPRVTYWEPAKWVARLRDKRTNDQTLIFKTNMEAGHGGRSGRFEYLWEKAEAYGFILKELANRREV